MIIGFPTPSPTEKLLFQIAGHLWMLLAHTPANIDSVEASQVPASNWFIYNVPEAKTREQLASRI